jgi:glycine/D-amino acid oxidase-like deaminating enzyme
MNQTSLDAQSFLYKTGLIYLQQNAETGDIWVGTESSKIQDILTADDTYVTEEARQTLRSFLPTYFQQGWGDDTTVTEFKGIWSGVQGHTADGLPLVGRVFDDLAGRACGDGEWIAAGFNGYGMDKCWLTGEALVKMIMGEDVSFWFPQCYLINEKRFQEDLKTQRILDKFTSIARTGSW